MYELQHVEGGSENVTPSKNRFFRRAILSALLFGAVLTAVMYVFGETELRAAFEAVRSAIESISINPLYLLYAGAGIVSLGLSYVAIRLLKGNRQRDVLPKRRVPYGFRSRYGVLSAVLLVAGALFIAEQGGHLFWFSKYVMRWEALAILVLLLAKVGPLAVNEEWEPRRTRRYLNWVVNVLAAVLLLVVLGWGPTGSTSGKRTSLPAVSAAPKHTGVTFKWHPNYDEIRLEPGAKFTYRLKEGVEVRWNAPKGDPGHYIIVNDDVPVLCKHNCPFDLSKTMGGDLLTLRPDASGSIVRWYKPRLRYGQ